MNTSFPRAGARSALALAGDRTVRPATHVATFAGDFPCDAQGRPLTRISAGSAPRSASAFFIREVRKNSRRTNCSPVSDYPSQWANTSKQHFLQKKMHRKSIGKVR